MLMPDLTPETNDFYPFLSVNAVTKITFPNHSDPYYTDVCYTITREICDFCCLVDFEFCSRDIGICLPVEDRNLSLILDCVMMFGGIVCGFPIIIKCCSCFISYRCCKNLYPATSGVSCYEFWMRVSCYICCVKFSETYKSREEDIVLDESGGGGSRGVLYWLFCCFLCPCFFKKGPSAHHQNLDEQGAELEEYEAVDGKEADEISEGH